MACQHLSQLISAQDGGQKAARLSSIFQEVSVPQGFVLTSWAYSEHVADLPLDTILATLDATDLDSLLTVSNSIKAMIQSKLLSPKILTELICFSESLDGRIAVRSSSVQEDLSDLSFAGQYDSFLDVENKLEALDSYVKLCWASLYTPRAMSYRHHNKIPQTDLSMAVILQDMVYGMPGVLFSYSPTECLIEFHKNGVVHGRTNANSIHIHGDVPRSDYSALKIKDQDILIALTKKLHKKFATPLDIEWVLGVSGFSILQVRPLKVSKRKTPETSRFLSSIPLLMGSAVGVGPVTGVVQKAYSPQDKIKRDSILVVRDTSPDWEPLMRQARALITDHGCRTSHASLVAAEMGLPAVVGTTDGTFSLTDGQIVTIDLDSDLGLVYGGAL